ncbi:bifunctional metallophosphatase/5'-nucleotidase [Hoyosella sp. G463]|uniref:Bifunctional metallophosphatase/5'-nucleotidase n=1 Tax=Lolliginicoccus lacisalsi TaxID=2742202 RepID=A0A927PN30_9ACTN|nr:5'-nucleotidase C-terminal domain-containing protein [Lolliginicoccus lacisalsi]MBD8507171.1 bifunctional metallophosphatase/5'-nucleotidase [Lolliginicoccus lacisalsi]
MSMRRHAVAASVIALALPILAAPFAVASPADDIEVRILSIGDLRSAFAPLDGDAGTVLQPDGSRINAGGAAHLGTYLDQLRRQADRSLFLSAGNNLAAPDEPSRTAVLRHEPVIDLLDAWGLDASAIGATELAEGIPELFRKTDGGCHLDEDCDEEATFDGASFPFVSSNIYGPTHTPLTSPFTIRHINGTPTGIIGATLHDDPGPGYTLASERETITNATEALQGLGVSAMVLLVNSPDVAEAAAGPSDCGASNTAAHDLATTAPPQIDLVLTSSSSPYTCLVRDPDGNDRPLLAAATHGRTVAVANLVIDGNTGDVQRDRVSVFNQIVTRDIAPADEVTATLDDLESTIGQAERRPVGTLTQQAPRPVSTATESPLGRLIADAAVYSHNDRADDTPAVAALIHPAFLRDDLTETVTYGDIFAAVDNTPLATIDIPGSILAQVLEQQFQDDRATLLQPSAALSYTIDEAAPIGSRVSGITLDGQPLQPGLDYRLVVDPALTLPGSGFTALDDITTSATIRGPSALRAYLADHAPAPVEEQDRITWTG